MKKILFGITSLGLGGAERVLVDLANKLSEEKEYEITVLTIYGNGELEKQLLPNIKLQNIYAKSYNELPVLQRKIIVPIYMLLAKSKIYKKYIKSKYDLEISFLEGPITRIFSCGKNLEKKIAWVHNDISQVFGTGIKAKLKRKIDEKLYNKFSKLIFVSKNNLESFENTYPNNKSEKQVIYNYIDSEKVLKNAKEKVEDMFDKNQINLVTVARLVQQKALDRLIKVHSRLTKEGIKHNIYIIGDGPEKEKLEELIKTQKCEQTVRLLGKKENPYPYIKEATYFCLLSNFEGYGMVLEEAKILNKNILITDTAAKEAIKDYKQARIFTNTEEGVYEGLKQVLTEQCKEDDTAFQYNNIEIISQIKEIFNYNN